MKSGQLLVVSTGKASLWWSLDSYWVVSTGKASLWWSLDSYWFVSTGKASLWWSLDSYWLYLLVRPVCDEVWTVVWRRVREYCGQPVGSQTYRTKTSHSREARTRAQILNCQYGCAHGQQHANNQRKKSIFIVLLNRLCSPWCWKTAEGLMQLCEVNSSHT